MATASRTSVSFDELLAEAGSTLSIGIASSMFTSIMVTRLIIVTWLRRRRPQALPI